MYSFNLENIVPSGGLACLIAKAIIDESNRWHRRLGHVNVKNLNKLVKGNLVRGLPSKIFQNDHTYVACQKGKQHKASWIKREYSNARTPQQNGVAERKNMTLIEAARTMLADSFLPNTFWDEAVSTACYVLNRVLVIKPQNKTPYELITGKIPIISYIRPFGCHVTILNTIDHLGKFDGKSDEGFLVGYSLQSKAFREKDQLGCIEDNIDACDSKIEAESTQDYFVLPIWSSYTSTVKSSKVNNAGEEPTKHPDFKQVDKEDQVFLDELERLKRKEQDANDAAEALRKEFAQETEDLLLQARAAKASSTNIVNTASTPVSTVSPYGGLSFNDLTNTDQDDSEISALKEIYDNPTDGIFTNSSYDDEGAVADFTNLEPVMNVSPIPTSRINYIHPSTLILGDPQLAVQTRSKVTKTSRAHAFVSYIQKQRRNNHKDFQHYLPYGKKAIGTKWVYRNKKDERGVVVINKERIEVIRIFLAFASYMGFIVYQMDVKSSFLYGKIDEEVYVSQPPGFLDPKYPQKVYKVKSWCDEFEALMKSRFQMSSMGELTFFLGLQVKQKADGIFISQDKYVAEILKKFDFINVKTGSTPIETQKPLIKDEEASDVDVHLYRSMIGSLMYLTASRPDIMFAVCACSRVSSFDLESYSDSDYVGANLDRKSTTGGCQFLARDSFLGNAKSRPLWLLLLQRQNMLLLQAVNLVYHSKTKHIAIRHHFIRDAYEKKLIQVLKIYTGLLTKAFDVSRESLRRVFDGTEALLLPTLFILWLAIDKQLENVPVPLDHFPVNALTSKVFSFMVKKGKHFSGKVTYLFTSMLVQPTEDEGAPSERPSEAQPTPSPLHTSEAHVEPQTDPSPRPLPSTTIPDSIPKSSGGNHGGHSSSDKSLSGNEGEMTLQSVYDLCISLCTQVSDQSKEIQQLKAQIKKLKKQAKHVVTHHIAWIKSVSLKHRLAGKRSLKKQWMQRESVSKQGRKSAKGEPSVYKIHLFDEIHEDKLVIWDFSTDKEKDSTDEQNEGTDDQAKGTDDHTEGEWALQNLLKPPTSTIIWLQEKKEGAIYIEEKSKIPFMTPIVDHKKILASTKIRKLSGKDDR
ncbi:putative ribonuclease H-like domain-containing protein [Tanacetum coccineum]